MSKSKQVMVTNTTRGIIHLLGNIHGAIPVSLIPGVATPVDVAHFEHEHHQGMVDNGLLVVGADAEEAQDAGAVAIMQGRALGVQTAASVKASNPLPAPSSDPNGDPNANDDANAGKAAREAASASGKPWESPGAAAKPKAKARK